MPLTGGGVTEQMFGELLGGGGRFFPTFFFKEKILVLTSLLVVAPLPGATLWSLHHATWSLVMPLHHRSFEKAMKDVIMYWEQNRGSKPLHCHLDELPAVANWTLLGTEHWVTVQAYPCLVRSQSYCFEWVLIQMQIHRSLAQDICCTRADHVVLTLI